MKKSLIMSVAPVIAMIVAANGAVIAEFNFQSLGTSGTLATDISGNNHNATFTNAATLVADNPFGQVGGMSLRPNTTDATARMANPGTINADTGWTMEAWVKLGDYVGNQASACGSIVAVQDTTSANQSLILAITAAGVPGISYYQSQVGSEVLTNYGTPIAANTWTHIAAVYNLGGWAMTLYVNGVSTGAVGVHGWNAGPLTAASIGDDGPFAISYGPLTGNILLDDVGLFNNQLAPSELGFSNPFPIPEPASLALLLGVVGLCGVATRQRR
jgi:hypothetical protein